MPPPPSPLAEHWSLDPGVAFLNHGSFGATPRRVRAQEVAWRDRLEAEPVRFFIEELEGLLDAVREELSPLIGARAPDWAFVSNATTAVNSVVRSLPLGPGDEVVSGSHEYNACHNALVWAAQRAGARVVRARWPFPVSGPGAVSEPLLAALTPRTRLVLLSAVTSPTGFITPYRELVPAIQARGVDVMLDAAHGPGFIDLDLSALAPAYATGNFHKWACAPKGSAFLYVRADRQEGIDPAVISHGYNTRRPGRSRFRVQFDYWGTEDPSRYLATVDAARLVPTFLGPHAAGLGLCDAWNAVIARNSALARHGRDVLCRALGTQPPVPDDMLGSMAAVLLPPHAPERAARLRARPTRYFDALQDALVSRHRVQVPIVPSDDGLNRWVRISAQLYNSAAQYEHLAGALREELDAEGRM